MTTTHHAWHAAPGKTCDCGQPATVVYQTKHGDVPYCGPHARIGEMDDVAPNELPDPGTLSLAEVLGELTMIAARELGTGLVRGGRDRRAARRPGRRSVHHRPRRRPRGDDGGRHRDGLARRHAGADPAAPCAPAGPRGALHLAVQAPALTYRCPIEAVIDRGLHSSRRGWGPHRARATVNRHGGRRGPRRRRRARDPHLGHRCGRRLVPRSPRLRW